MHTLIKTLEDLRERMQAHRSTDIANKSGIHVNTVRSIRNGVNLNPTIGAIAKIEEALEELDND